jgi:acyl dehydratase
MGGAVETFIVFDLRQSVLTGTMCQSILDPNDARNCEQSEVLSWRSRSGSREAQRRHTGRARGRAARLGVPGLYFDDFVVGATYQTVGRTVTESDIGLFAGLSGDHHQLHTDELWVRKNTDFPGRIAHGPLGLSIAMGLGGLLGLTAGTTIAFVEIERWKFKGPILIGDTIRVEIEIAEMRETSKPDVGVLKRDYRVINQRDEVVQEGRTVVLVKRRPIGEAK